MWNYGVNFKKILGMSVLLPILLSLSLFGATNAVNIMPLGDSITHENYRDDVLDAATPDENRTAYRDDLWYTLQRSEERRVGKEC